MTNPYAKQHQHNLSAAPAQNAEGWALVEMARRLEEARQNPDDREGVREAIRLNWRIWTILQSALVEPDNHMPPEIREDLLNLSNFIDKRSVGLLADPDVQEMTVLININRQVGAGLMGNPSDDPDETARLREEAAQHDGTDDRESRPAEENTAPKPSLISV